MIRSAPLSAILATGLAILAIGGTIHATSAPAVPIPRSLVGETQDAVRRLLGEPDVAHAEGDGALWTYRFESCALMIGFRQSDHGLKVTSTFAGPRQRGQPLPSTAECLVAGLGTHRESATRPPPLPRESTIGPLSPQTPQTQVPQ